MFSLVNTNMYSFFVYYSNMNMHKSKPRSFTETLTLLCKAKGGKLLKKNDDVNQTEIAKLAGTSQANVSRWYKGDHTPHSDNIEKLAKAFKITPGQMRGETPIDFIDGVTYQTTEDSILFAQISSLPDELKNMIREQVAIYQKLNKKNE